MSVPPLEVTLTREQYEAMMERLENLEPILKLIGRELVTNARAAFDNQGIGSDRWPPPYNGGPFNLAGIVEDLKTSSTIHEYNLRSRPALKASNKLYDSMSLENVHYGPNFTELTSPLPYSGMMQEGGTDIKMINESIRTNLQAFLRSHPNYRKQLGFIGRPGYNQMVTEVHPRPFLSVEPDQMDRMVEMLQTWLVYG